ncbi:MAG: tetratricopeptide repeat protein [Cytophagales bacterium]|nr:MAG: tetratricopeptide repeat protein [Cytophagales bacterium]
MEIIKKIIRLFSIGFNFDYYLENTTTKMTTVNWNLFLSKSVGCFLLAITLSPLSVSAQNQVKIDSLIRLLSTEEENAQTAEIYNGLSEEYTEIDVKEAINYAQKALQTAKNYNNERAQSEAYKNLGIAYQRVNKHIDALKNFLAALGFMDKLKNEKGRAECLRLMGNSYKSRNMYEKAIESYSKALEIYEQTLKNKKGSAAVLNDLAEAYLELARNNNAFECAKRSETLAQEIKADEELCQASLIISKIYARKKEFDKAHEYHMMYNELKDSLFKKQTLLAIEKTEKRFRQEQYRREQEQAKLEAQQQASYVQYFLILLVMTLLFATIALLGKFNIPMQLSRNLIFISLFSVAQFLLMLIKPLVEKYTGGLPFFIFLINTFMAYGLVMINRRLEKRINNTVIKPIEDMEERRREHFSPID